MQLLAAIVIAQPVTNVIVEIILIVQPATFGDVKAERAADGLRLREKFSEDKSVGRLLKVFAK